MRMGIVTMVCGCAVAGLVAPATAWPPGWVLSQQKISDTEGEFTGILEYRDQFGCSVASLGDLDGDSVGDLAVGALEDDDGGNPPWANRGAVWILFLDSGGTVKSHQKISDTEGEFTGILGDNDYFGRSVASLGDLNGDGVRDLAVGASGDDDGRGAVWILFLDSGGTVKSHQKISDTEGEFTGILDNYDWFGDSVASPGDLNGDGVRDLAVGAPGDDDGGPAWANRGAVWILFLDTDGTVLSHQKISDTEGEFTGPLGNGDRFGDSVSSLGDLNRDGVRDLAVGAPFSGYGDWHPGAVWILFLDSDGTVKEYQCIQSLWVGGFPEILDNYDWFGESLALLWDLDGDWVVDLAVGAPGDDDRGHDHGAVWILSLNRNGTVKSILMKIADNHACGFTGILHDHDEFGSSVASLGDLDGDWVVDLAVGAPWDSDGGWYRGAVWVLFLDGVDPRYAVTEFPACDLNCDGWVNVFDIDPFFLALTDAAGYVAAWPDCDIMLADINGDGWIDAFDIDPFVELLTGG